MKTPRTSFHRQRRESSSSPSRRRLDRLPLTALLLLLATATPLAAQSLINIDFGVGSRSSKTGFAATGLSTNDYWNLYRHYDPKFVPGTPLVNDGKLENLKLSDGTDTKVSLSVANAPGVWGNGSGDAMFDTYLFSQNGSNMLVQIRELPPGHYHFYLYGHADADVIAEQNSVFVLKNGTNTFGPLTSAGTTGWKATSAWREGYQFVVFRDVDVTAENPVVIEVAPGANGIAVLNGLQISSRGTSPPKLITSAASKNPSPYTNIFFRAIRYEGKVTDDEARFVVSLQVESLGTNEISGPLFEGDVALVVPELPEGLRIVSQARQYRLYVSKPGVHQLQLDLVAKINRAEPWNTISFVGPPATMGAVSVRAANEGVEMQLLSGTQLNAAEKAVSHVEGTLGTDRTLSLRWQGKTSEIARKSLVTVYTIATAQVTPTVIKYTTQLRYDILQAPVPSLVVALPAGHTLTRLQGEQIRDWQVKTDVDPPLLKVEFIKPVEKSYQLTLLSEQTIDKTPLQAQLSPPQPLQVERESGSFSISADDVTLEVETAAGLRQVNAPAGTLVAYRFYGRPITLTAQLKRIQPVVQVADRVSARLEETRLLVSHALTLNVDKAGIYTLELSPPAGFVVAEVRGEGIDDWNVAGQKLQISFGSRLIGARQVEVQLEQALKTFPDQITIQPLAVPLATNQTAQVGAASGLGIRLKTAGDVVGLREIPVGSLPGASDEQLAFNAEQPDWKLVLSAERLPPRIMAEVFNLVTVGDGLVGGSATMRYGLINQGVQEFRVQLRSIGRMSISLGLTSVAKIPPPTSGPFHCKTRPGAVIPWSSPTIISSIPSRRPST